MSRQYYEFVLKDLISQRDNLNRTIETIQRIMDSGIPTTVLTSSSLGPPPSHIPKTSKPVGVLAGLTSETGNVGALEMLSFLHEHKPFEGMSILSAIKKLLKYTQEAMKASEIADRLQEGGLKFDTETPANTVASILSRYQQEGDQDIVKVERGLWRWRGEWYQPTPDNLDVFK